MTIKKKRRLVLVVRVLVVRETPLSQIDLDNMLALANCGAVIFPPMLAFYIRPGCIEDLVQQNEGRMLDMLGIESDGFKRWDG